MRFKRGSKVEVMSETEVLNSWRCAEIISGNGHTYSVKYDCYLGSKGKVFVERVSRKAIRPCPPPVEGFESWVAGDIVEVFDDISWKIVTVLKVLSGDHYLVRPIGFSQEFSTHRSNIRLRQSWKNDKWFVIGKGSGSCRNVKSNKLSTSNCYQKGSFQVLRANRQTELQVRDDCFAFQNNSGLQESQIVSSRMPKRASLCCSSLIEVYICNDQKRRAIEKEGRQRAVPAQLQEKVDAVAYPRENLGEEYMHASLNNRLNGYYEMERAKLNGVINYSIARSSGPSDSDCDACSVGSCGDTSKSPNKNPSHSVAVPCQDTETIRSDAESFYGLRGEEENCPLPHEEVVASIRRLELHAYHCTLEALYASGPLSWEQEALLTNLRITLRISNDEHLMELRNLISSGTGIHLS